MSEHRSGSASEKQPKSEQYGELSHQHGYVTAVMERTIEVSATDIWQMLSSEAQRVKWLAPGTIDMKIGGRAVLDFKDSYVLVDSEVTQCQAPNLLEFSWSSGNDPERPVRFEISPHSKQDTKQATKQDTNQTSHIKLTVSIPDNEVVARSCAGWEAHLTMLQAAALGVSVKFPLERFKASREFFDDQLAQIMMSEVPFLRL